MVERPYSALLDQIDERAITSVRTNGNAVYATSKSGERFVVYVPEGAMAETVSRLHEAGARITSDRARPGPTIADILLGVLPMLLLIGAWAFFMWKMQKKPPDALG